MEVCKETQQGKNWALGGALFLLLMARNCAFGFQYWPQLDDYIQHHNYAAGFTFAQLQEIVGVLSSRPLAGLADYFLWSPMFDQMILGVALISLLYAVSVVLMRDLLARYFPVGPLFPVIMALLPLGVEGTYWMSASTRVVAGLFFACLAAAAFGRWLDGGRWQWAAAFLILTPLPFGFYEQSAVLAMTLALGMALLECRKRKGRTLLALWVVPAAGLYFWVTGLLSNGGVYGSRANLMLPGMDGYWTTFLPDILGQIRTVFLQGNFYTLAKGLVRGVRLIVSGRLLPWAAAVLLLCILYGWLALREEGRGEKGGTALALLAGVLLTAAPLTPFLILANPWFSLRGAVTAMPGIALACDTLLMALWRKLSDRRTGPAVLAALTALVFCVAGASEIGDYRDTYQNDQKAARTVLSRLSADFPSEESREGVRVGILGVEASFLPNQNFYWHEHIHGCTESGWAFTGLLVSLAGEGMLPSVTPLPTDPIYRRWNAEANRPAGFEVLYFYDGEELDRAELEETGENAFSVRGEDGTIIGVIWEEDGIGYFRRPDQMGTAQSLEQE